MRRPVFIAEQARHPRGILGRIIANIMAKETRGDNFWAIETLAPAPSDRVLDIGTGHGSALSELAARTPSGTVTGIDPSTVMTDMAVRRNEALIKGGRVQVLRAEADKLPFEDGSFDKAMAVHVIYFWRSLDAPLGEIARVLAPGGRLVLLFRARDDPRTAAFPKEVYHFPSVDEVTMAMEHAGFAIDRITPTVQPERPTPVVIRATRSGAAPVRLA